MAALSKYRIVGPKPTLCPTPLGWDRFRRGPQASTKKHARTAIAQKSKPPQNSPLKSRALRQQLIGKDLQEREHEETNKVLRDRELFYHTRFLLTFGIIPWWLFAIGLALTLPSRNRLTAIATGILSIIVTVMPGFALVKGMRGQLMLNPAYLLYIPAALLFCFGLYLLYRRR